MIYEDNTTIADRRPRRLHIPISVACDKTPLEQTQDEAEEMEEAKDKAGVKPSGTEDEAQDTPIEGTPEEVIGEMRSGDRSLPRQNLLLVEGRPEDLLAKIESISAKIDKMDNEMSVDELQAEELSESAELNEVAQVKKEWNQTKRQVDVALGTTESESEDSKK